MDEHDRFVLIDFNGECKHEIYEKKSQIRGSERKELGLKILACGTQNIKNEHVIHNKLGK